jgi:hypothetical protein
MMMNNMGMRSMPEAKEDNETKTDTTNVCEKTDYDHTVGDIMNTMTGLFGASMTSEEIKELHKCFHELDKRVYGLEVMMKHLTNTK